LRSLSAFLAEPHGRKRFAGRCRRDVRREVHRDDRVRLETPDFAGRSATLAKQTGHHADVGSDIDGQLTRIEEPPRDFAGHQIQNAK